MPSISSDTAATLLDEHEQNRKTIYWLTKSLLNACHQAADVGDAEDMPFRVAMRTMITVMMEDYVNEGDIETTAGFIIEATDAMKFAMLKELDA